MLEIGLQCPILIRVVEGEDGIGNSIVLVAGATRLAAAKKLEWDKIEAIEINGDEIDAELVEIAENLHRVDLSKDQRDNHIRRYAELFIERLRQDARTAETRQTGAFSHVGAGEAGPGRGHKGIASKVAAETGLSTRTVQRVLSPKPPAQPTLVPPQHKPINPAGAINNIEAVNKQFNRLMAAWNAAGPEAREKFLDAVDDPTFDRTRAGAA